MAAINPIQMMMMLKNGDPKTVAEQIIHDNYSNNPMMANLLELGNKGDTQGLEKIAQQILQNQGRDFNTEFQNLMAMAKNM